MQKIRLLRCGRKNDPRYVIVLTCSSSPRDGRHQVVICSYNPFSNEILNIDFTLIEQFVKNGAQISPRVKMILRKAQKQQKIAA